MSLREKQKSYRTNADSVELKFHKFDNLFDKFESTICDNFCNWCTLCVLNTQKYLETLNFAAIVYRKFRCAHFSSLKRARELAEVKDDASREQCVVERADEQMEIKIAMSDKATRNKRLTRQATEKIANSSECMKWIASQESNSNRKPIALSTALQSHIANIINIIGEGFLRSSNGMCCDLRYFVRLAGDRRVEKSHTHGENQPKSSLGGGGK